MKKMELCSKKTHLLPEPTLQGNARKRRVVLCHNLFQTPTGPESQSTSRTDEYSSPNSQL